MTNQNQSERMTEEGGIMNKRTKTILKIVGSGVLIAGSTFAITKLFGSKGVKPMSQNCYDDGPILWDDTSLTD